MVHKNITYGNVQNVTVAEFGRGTIGIVDGANTDGHLALLIKSNEVMPIGEVGTHYDNSDDFKPELVLAFHNVEGFNVFYEFVENIRTAFSDDSKPLAEPLNQLKD